MLVCIYVYDLILTGTNHQYVNEFKEAIYFFEIIDMGLLYFLLGLKFIRLANEYSSLKRKLIWYFKRFEMEERKPILTPMGEKLKITKEGIGEFVNATLYEKVSESEVSNIYQAWLGTFSWKTQQIHGRPKTILFIDFIFEYWFGHSFLYGPYCFWSSTLAINYVTSTITIDRER